MYNKMNLDCLPARASSARAGFHSITKRGESMNKQNFSMYPDFTTYRGFDIVYDDSTIGHLRGWYYVPVLHKRAFSVRGAKNIITKYINEHFIDLRDINNNKINKNAQIFDLYYSPAGAVALLIVEVAQDIYTLYDMQNKSFFRDSRGVIFYNMDDAYNVAGAHMLRVYGGHINNK